MRRRWIGLFVATLVILQLSSMVVGRVRADEGSAMHHAIGTFEIKMTPQAPQEGVGDAAIGRMAMNKTFDGELKAASKGEMLGAMTAVKGSAGYVAMERVVGTLAGKKGSFVLQHSGTMSHGDAVLHCAVVPDSGTEDLVGLSGTMEIKVEGGMHHYDLAYDVGGSR